MGEIQGLAQAQCLACLECGLERGRAEAAADRPAEAVQDLALGRQWRSAGFLTQVGRGAEQPGGPLVIVSLDRDPRQVFHQHDRGPVVLDPRERRECDGEPPERAVRVPFGEGEPAPHRGEVRDRLVIAVLETEGDALVERRPSRREVAAGLRYPAQPIQHVGDPVPRLHGPREVEGLRPHPGRAFQVPLEQTGLPQPDQRAYQIH